jgi:RNAse (barnase) inhibitor barstar
MTELKEFIIDGSKISSIQGFLNAFGNAVTPRLKFALVTNLDAFDDILSGGIATPYEGFILRWQNSNVSRKLLGHNREAAILRGIWKSSSADKKAEARKAWLAAKSGVEPGDFDMLVELIRAHGPGGEYPEDNVHLVLE